MRVSYLQKTSISITNNHFFPERSSPVLLTGFRRGCRLPFDLCCSAVKAGSRPEPAVSQAGLIIGTLRKIENIIR